MTKNWQKLLLEIFSILTVLLAGGHLAHLWSAEWLAVLSALVTAVLATLNLGSLKPEVLPPPEPTKPTAAPTPKKG